MTRLPFYFLLLLIGPATLPVTNSGSIVDTGQKYSCSQSSTVASLSSGGGWRRREIKTMPLGDYLINYTDVILDCTIYQTSFLLMTLSGSDSGFHVR